MPRAAFTKASVKRTVEAAIAAGLHVVRVEVDWREGKFTVVTDENAKEVEQEKDIVL